jgi:6-pyruvoyltetrahydropterin/6-carboxytetrahydropterin synthase
MFVVTVEGSFSAAHRLAGYQGKCERLHGHNYRIRVSVKAQKLDKQGMVIDFTELKKELEKILEMLDHSYLNEHEEFSDGTPTAERIAYYVYCQLKQALPTAQINKVVVYETDKNKAAYYPE